jgi:hypothetical protein
LRPIGVGRAVAKPWIESWKAALIHARVALLWGVALSLCPCCPSGA